MKVRLCIFNSFSDKNRGHNRICGAVFAVIAIVLTFSCSSKVASVIPTDLINKKIPSVEATEFQTFITDSGVVRYFLKTPKLLIFDREKEPYKEFPEGFHLQRFDVNKKIISELSANYGKNFERQQRWLATGNVIMVNNKGDTLRTEELNYLIQQDRIFTDKFVNIKKGDQNINARNGFESDSQMSKYSLKKTKGRMYVDEQ